MSVKLECHLSPKLFTEVINEVIATIIEASKIFSKEAMQLKLSIVLVYAGEIIIIIEDEKELQLVLDGRKMVLPSTRVTINFAKSAILNY